LKKSENLKLNVCLAVILTSLLVFFFGTPLFQRLELLTLDTLFQFSTSHQKKSSIVIIEIDNKDLDAIGRWPWDRSVLASMVKILNNLGAKQICLDLFMAFPSTKKDDNQLAQSIKESGNVYLPYVLTNKAFSEDKTLRSIDVLTEHIKDTGIMNTTPDIDGTVRSVPLFFQVRDKTHYHLMLQMAMDYLGYSEKRIEGDAIVLSNGTKEFSIPLYKNYRYLIRWLGKWRNSFNQFSFSEVLNAYKEKDNDKSDALDLSSIKDSIVFIAVTATGLHDIKSNPLEAQYPGVGIMASVVDNIIQQEFIFQFPIWLNVMLAYLLVLFPALITSHERPMREIITFFILVGTVFIGYMLFKNGYYVNIMLLVSSVFGSYVVISSFNFVSNSLEKEKYLQLANTDELTGLFNMRYFKGILQIECQIAKRDKSRSFCIVICDIDHFKKFNDKYGHLVGDTILTKVAMRLKDSIRAIDVIARYGGEEVMILLRTNSLSNAKKIAEKLRSNIEKLELSEKNKKYQVTISLGVAKFDHEHDDETSVLKKADVVLYEAKRLGRNRVCIDKDGIIFSA